MTDFLDPAAVPEWLDDITGERALQWAAGWSDETSQKWDSAARTQLQARIQNALDATDRIAMPVRRGEYLYNYWVDAEHPRGLWRRTTLDSFTAGAEDPQHTQWETVLDVDALADAEGENWVWKGAQVLRPSFDRALIRLSRGGADATVVREFDLTSCAFVTEQPFTLPEAKSELSWIDRDEVLVGTDCGAGSLTSSGYPRQVRRWRRGTDVAQSEVVFAGHEDDVAVAGWFDTTEGFRRLFVERAKDFYLSRRFVGTDDGLQIIEVPEDCRVSVHREYVVLLPRTDFAGIPAGGMGVGKLDDWLAGGRDVEVLFTPDAHTSLQSVAWTRDYLVLTVLRDVATELELRRVGSWQPVELPGVPEQATVQVIGTDSEHSNELWLHAASALKPPTLLRAELADAGADPDSGTALTVLRQAPGRFDSSGMTTQQHWAVSADGTRIPYRVTGVLDGAPKPTLVHAYGGFEVSLVPGYAPVTGVAWLAGGGLSVQANLRGGGEFGPGWHSQAVQLNRRKVYEDHQAVLRDLVERGYTTAEQLAVRGGSNGGLLTAVCLTSYPELVGAVVCQVPLADMMRYHRLSAGASWMAEYGNPDIPEQRAAIAEYSPVQRVARATDRQYPPVLVTTSTRDDRVHPAHARSLAYLLAEAGQDVDYWENIEGGHGGAADNRQAAFAEALIYSWLWQRIGQAGPATG
ncbi:prolyl oligopeptidase family serine peptidase [Corynebacterium sp. TAE3-ERU12]|uniref:prolyl oligopeptidase family serine peptidase n=1 Tax=Corynebacterium sp. TAE3-ERU12 TaxID=2849491 RepID=UPI001C482F26|nr:prolyl oligopeptidase family serine peptidase [Corynebacterium sp. TAE3-ERU12]MBV7294507.1 prolyl oligopeptidase family serine peptidase [Corynebacterium sp. TAE3-ERU12]